MPGIAPIPPVTTAAAQSPPAQHDDGFSFADFLDVINPLQHIPVISTLYRHITGDTIGIPEKIAGDTLYGGVIGLVSSLADTGFQEITGKNFGDTVYAALFGDDKTATASAAPATIPASVTPAAALDIQTPDVAALINALSQKDVDSGTAARAVYAYGRTVSLTTDQVQPIN